MEESSLVVGVAGSEVFLIICGPKIIEKVVGTMNHDYASTGWEITDFELHSTLESLCVSTFFKVDGLGQEGLGEKWVVHVEGHSGYGCQVWRKSKRKIALRAASGGEIAGWVRECIQNKVATAFGNGRCSSEGAPGTWAPNPVLPSFRSYYLSRYGAAGKNFWSKEAFPSFMKALLK